MRSVSSADSGILPSGTIRFYEACIPPLQAGPYQMVATQSVTIPNANPQPTPYSTTQPFSVYGPRFALQPADVQMVYPPANQQGTFYQSLPSIVLSQRALPWSRIVDPLQPTAPPPNTPWLALLTIHAFSEMNPQAPLVTMPQQMQVSEIVTPSDNTILGPALGTPQQGTISAAELLQNANAFDIDAGLFAAIAPSQTDLPLLNHAREVDTSAKETSGGVQNGFYSVVVGNRLPDSASDGPRDSWAFLVSLEGHWDHLPGGSGTGTSKQVRLIVLGSWKFTSTQNDGDFLAIMQALPSRGGVDLLTMPFNTAAPVVTEPEQYAREGLVIGYAPRLDSMRAGEKTTSWFRGALAPYPTAADPYGPYSTSDAAIRYDPGRGIFDRSYATAWQVGRLLALADGDFTRSMMAWRRKLHFEAAQQSDDELLAKHLGAPAANASQPAARKSRLHAMLLRLVRSRFGPVSKGSIKLPVITPRRRRLDPQRLLGLVPAKVLQEAAALGLDPVQAILAHRSQGKPPRSP